MLVIMTTKNLSLKDKSNKHITIKGAQFYGQMSMPCFHFY